MAILGKLQTEYIRFMSSLYRDVSFYSSNKNRVTKETIFISFLSFLFIFWGNPEKQSWKRFSLYLSLVLFVPLFLFVLHVFDLGFLFFYYFLVVEYKRDSWIVSFLSCRNCKMIAILILWLKWCPFTLRKLKNF